MNHDGVLAHHGDLPVEKHVHFPYNRRVPHGRGADGNDEGRRDRDSKDAQERSDSSTKKVSETERK